MNSNERIENRLEELGQTIERSESFVNNVMSRVNTGSFGEAETRLSAWRIIMRSKMTKFAAAAVIVIGAMIVVSQFGGSIDGSSVAWASLAERVGSIQTCFFKGHTKINGGSQEGKAPQVEMEVYVSSEYGFRSDIYMDGKISHIQYAIPAEKVMISVMPTQKKYMRMLLTDEMLEKMRLQGNDPREMVRQFVSGEYTHIGESVIDGVKVEGIETTDPKAGGGQFEKYLARCWVDVETQLPILIEMEMEMFAGADEPAMKMSMTMDSFEWDIDLDPEIFEPEIPSDYELLAEMQMPGQDEGSTVNGLRKFAEITDGKYPKKLTSMDIMREYIEAVKNSSEKEWQIKLDSDPDFKPTQEEKDEVLNKAMKDIITVQGACMFYVELVQTDKDAAYYGDKVTSDDVNAVLMRWKISESEYRVIYGDLTSENVTAERLAELEEGI